MESFNQLSSLGSWSCTHVQHLVVRFHPQDQWWNHGDSLLSRDGPSLCTGDQEIVQLPVDLHFPYVLPCHIQLISQIIRVPWEHLWDSHSLLFHSCFFT